MADGSLRERRSHLWEREPDNWYVEPSWVSRRLFEAESFVGRVIDPCAGLGHVIKGAAEAGVTVHGYDLRERGVEGVQGGWDFLAGDANQFPGRYPVENIVANPPYGPREGGGRLEESFLARAMDRTRCKVALFLPASWAHARPHLPDWSLYRIYQVGPRPSCPPGQAIRDGIKPGNGKTDYSWFVFLHGFSGAPTLHWLRRDHA